MSFRQARCALTNQLQVTNTIRSDICHFQNRVELARQLICWEKLRRLVKQEIATSGLTAYLSFVCLHICHHYLHFLYIYIYILQLLYTTPGKPNVQIHKQLLSARHWFDRWLNVPGTFPTILIFVYVHAHAYTKSRKHSFQKMKLINYLTKLFNGMLHGAGDIWFSFLIICVRRKKKRGAPQTVIHFSSWDTILSALVYFVQPW